MFMCVYEHLYVRACVTISQRFFLHHSIHHSVCHIMHTCTNVNICILPSFLCGFPSFPDAMNLPQHAWDSHGFSDHCAGFHWCMNLVEMENTLMLLSWSEMRAFLCGNFNASASEIAAEFDFPQTAVGQKAKGDRQTRTLPFLIDDLSHPPIPADVG